MLYFLVVTLLKYFMPHVIFLATDCEKFLSTMLTEEVNNLPRGMYHRPDRELAIPASQSHSLELVQTYFGQMIGKKDQSIPKNSLCKLILFYHHNFCYNGLSSP